MYVLGIESTAHTFGIGIVKGKNILADVRYIYKPIKTLGIDPREAAEHHSKIAAKALNEALNIAGISMGNIDIIAYAMGPGLGPCLRVGATMARFLSTYYSIPLYPVHHGIGHAELASLLLNMKDPMIILVSGGHTAILGFNMGRWRIYGETLDITIGNLLDSFARKAKIPFPGGPKIESLASKSKNFIKMPYTIKGNNVVYSGLLTYAISLLGRYSLEDICYSLQEIAFSTLVEAAERALVQLRKREIALTGGVAANNHLYKKFKTLEELHNIKVGRTELKYNLDNGVQIAIVGYLYAKAGYRPIEPEKAKIKQRIRIEKVDIPWRD